MKELKAVAVYCASSTQLPQKYYEAAACVGELLGRRGATLVNGAGNMGLMQASSDACLAAGGKVVGVMPTFMIEQDWHHRGLTELVETPDMNARKALMAERSDAAIVLPGGVGTMDEFFDIITLKQLGVYLKPIVLLNLDGFYDPLLELFDRMVAENFMRDVHRDIWRVAATADEAVELAFSTPMWDGSIRRFAKI
ncbi:MAG: TIGR00730 family Rossman fold protein [Bacteroidaceae bacterium]|nr:TIGR00730 family Rossman fold protein [Bacteroidaceae bacterium]